MGKTMEKKKTGRSGPSHMVRLVTGEEAPSDKVLPLVARLWLWANADQYGPSVLYALFRVVSNEDTSPSLPDDIDSGVALLLRLEGFLTETGRLTVAAAAVARAALHCDETEDVVCVRNPVAVGTSDHEKVKECFDLPPR